MPSDWDQMLNIEVFAQDCIETDLGCVPQDPAGFTSSLYGFGLALIGGVALLSIIYGAYLVLSSGGDPAQLKKGKSYIVYAILGVLLGLAGFAFYNIVTVDVIRIPGFS